MSLKGEQEGSATTDHTDQGESLGIVDNPDRMVDNPGGHSKCTAALEPSKTTTSRVVEANSPRTSEDPGDVTDDDAHHPDEPTEPPDNAESARVRGGEERVEERCQGCRQVVLMRQLSQVVPRVHEPS